MIDRRARHTDDAGLLDGSMLKIEPTTLPCRRRGIHAHVAPRKDQLGDPVHWLPRFAGSPHGMARKPASTVLRTPDKAARLGPNTFPVQLLHLYNSKGAAKMVRMRR